MNLKQYILINCDLEMSQGKQISAGAHASLGIFFDLLKSNKKNYLESRSEIFPTDFTSCRKYEFTVENDLIDWIEGPFTKICLKGNEVVFEHAIELAKQAGVLYKLIEDIGNTEVTPGSKTALAIGPFDLDKSINSKVTGFLKSLPLLK